MIVRMYSYMIFFFFSFPLFPSQNEQTGVREALAERLASK